MKKFDAGDIRTVALVGHGKSGKTSLGEALLFETKVSSRLGKVDDETSLLDSEPEALARKASIQLALGSCEWKRRKINFVDTPGDANFSADALLGLWAADTALLLVSGADGVQVGTERAWTSARERALPVVVFVSKLDRERASFAQALEQVRRLLSDKAVALQLPIGQAHDLSGIIDLLPLKTLTLGADGHSAVVGEIPEALRADALLAREQAVEAIAATDDKLIEKYLETGALSDEELRRGLLQGLLAGTLVPVLCGAATRNLGSALLLDFLADCCPPPTARAPAKGRDRAGQPKSRAYDPAAPFSGFVFKTIASDIGRLTLLRVVSGTLGHDSQLINARTGAHERVGQLYTLVGKRRDTLEQATVGDLVGLPKLKDAHTGDTLVDEHDPIVFAAPELPAPVIGFSLRPKAKGDEEKLAARLADLLLEDASLHLDRDPVTHELLLRGLGQAQIELAVGKLKRHGVEVELELPRIPYRETIKGQATHVEGKHKKQSGGRGQYGVVYLDIEPKPKDSEVEGPLEFVDEVFGGAIPRQFIPSIEKGIRDRMLRGGLSGCPVVDVRVTLKDGKYHPVDSDGRSFERAGSKGFQAAFRAAHPILLEPISSLEIVCPAEFIGDVIGDLSSRRGRVLGTEAFGQQQAIRAEVPQAEILRYAIDLESITAGRGHFHVAFAHYQELPANLAEKVIGEAKVAEEED
ncbi:MAG: elongation factor G [Proteobacteria bacterium]|nr:elongation factor G [Pseudomonadota bacterium]